MTAEPTPARLATFRHEAFFYGSDDAFYEGTLAFLRAGIAGNEAALVVVSAAKIRSLRAALGADADRVRFADMADVGANPARIIPAWSDFVADNLAAGRAMRGIGEPIYPERRPAELVECQRHEALLNTAFANGPGWALLCPYDTARMPAPVVAAARKNHPFAGDLAGRAECGDYDDHVGSTSWWADPLPEVPVDARRLPFGPATLALTRTLLGAAGRDVGLSAGRIDDVVLIVSELASNSIEHGGGGGRIAMWTEDGVFVIDVRDDGRFSDPLVGRRRPPWDACEGRGLWLANQLCDLVQVRSDESGSAVRVHIVRN